MSHKLIDIFVAIIIVGVIITLIKEENKKGANISASSMVNSINPFEKRFSNLSECTNYVNGNAGNREKLNLGYFACSTRYGANTAAMRDTAVSFAQCILNNMKEISDDNTGKKVVTKCAEINHEPMLGIFFSSDFDPAERVAKAMREERSKMQFRGNMLPGIMENVESGDGIVNLNVGGNLIPCMKIGPEISCN